MWVTRLRIGAFLVLVIGVIVLAGQLRSTQARLVAAEAAVVSYASQVRALEERLAAPPRWNLEDLMQNPETGRAIREYIDQEAQQLIRSQWRQVDPEKQVGLWLNALGWEQRRLMASPELAELLPQTDEWRSELPKARAEGLVEWNGDVQILELDTSVETWAGEQTSVTVRLPFAPRNNRSDVRFYQEMSFKMRLFPHLGWVVEEVTRTHPDVLPYNP